MNTAIKHRFRRGEGKLPEGGTGKSHGQYLFKTVGESDYTQVFWAPSQTGSKAIRITVTQKLISLCTWQEEGEREKERGGVGVKLQRFGGIQVDGGFPTAQSKTSGPLKMKALIILLLSLQLHLLF